mgnify:CR=1 FL=1
MADDTPHSMTAPLSSQEVLEASAAWYATKHGIAEPYQWTFKKLAGDVLELQIIRVANVQKLTVQKLKVPHRPSPVR